jgi:uncharacterized protein
MFEYWFLFPVGIAICATLTSAGVSGATLWVPVYLLWLGLSVPLAFWLGLLTMLFGFGSGVYRNWCDRSYDAALVRNYLTASAPAAFAGGWLAGLVNESVLVGFFSLFLFIYSATIAIRTIGNHEPAERRDSISYPLAVAGGMLTGLISIGVGILALPALLRHQSVRNPGNAIGSLVMIIFFTSLAASVGRLRPAFVADIGANLPRLGAILLWAIPAVTIGGQVGPRLAQKLSSERQVRLYFSTLLLIIGVLTLTRANITVFHK